LWLEEPTLRLELTDEQKMIQDMAAGFAKSELAPVAAELDETKDRSILKANLKKMAELGLMTMNIPETYGGADVGVVAYSLAMTEIARACAATAVTMSVTNMVAEVILEYGTEEQKQKYIPRLAGGEYYSGAFGLTETQAGSDPGNMRTMAVRDGSDFVINGSKIFITSAEYAGVFVIWTVTDQGAGRGRGISAFLIEPGTPGFAIGKDENKMGQRGSSTNELLFEDCRVPESQLLGEVDRGFPIALMELDGGRIGIGSLALGVGFAAMDFTVDYAKQREQFGKAHRRIPGHSKHDGRPVHGTRSRANAGSPGGLAQRERTNRSPGKPPWPSCTPANPPTGLVTQPCKCWADTDTPATFPWNGTPGMFESPPCTKAPAKFKGW
jgi:alkylation response protein AidB-like acyl-CoA dehydrogenase